MKRGCEMFILESLCVISWILYLRKLLRYILKLTCLQCSWSGPWAHNIVQKFMDEDIFLTVKARRAIFLKIAYWVSYCLTPSSVIRIVGQKTLPSSLQITSNWWEWLIYWKARLGYCSDGPQQSVGIGQEEPLRCCAKTNFKSCIGKQQPCASVQT